MRAAECRQEVVQRFGIRDVHDAEADPQLRAVAVQQVVGADAEVEEMARGDACRVIEIVLGAVGGDAQTRRTPAC